MYNPNGINQQGPYPPSKYSNQLSSSYCISSPQSTGNTYGDGYPSSSLLIPPNDLQTSSTSWNQYVLASLSNNNNQINYDPNIYYASYYSNLFAQQYYQ